MKKKPEEQPQGQWCSGLKNGNPRCDLSLLPRCNATAKSTAVRCKQPSMKNGKCYWHGGKSTGPPRGNRNAFKHGMYSGETIEQNKLLRQLLRHCTETLDSL